MLLREIMAVYCENHTNGQSLHLFNVKYVVLMATTVH